MTFIVYTVLFILLCNVVCLTCAKPTDDDPFPLRIPGGGIGGIFKGPNKETIIQGPDGSVITAENEPGIIVQSHALKEPKKEIIVAEEPIATVEKIATIAQPIQTILQDVQPIATALIAPTQIITSNKVADDRLFLNGEILNGPIARGSVLESKRILVPRPKAIETTVVEQQPQPISFTPQQPLLPAEYSLSTLAPQYAPKISLAPQKITLSSTPAPPVLSASTLAPILLSSTLSPRVISSTLAPQVLSSTLDSRDLQGFSSTISSDNLIDTGRIDLGGGELRIAIPVVEYASSNGFVNNARAEILGYNIGQTTARIDDVSNVNWLPSVTGSPLKDTQINIDDLPQVTQGFGSAKTPLLYKRSAIQRRQIYNNGFMAPSYTNRRTNIQKIPKFGPKSIRIDDKIDMGHEYRTYRGLNNRNSDTVQLPETLRTQLAQYLPRQRNSEVDNGRGRVVIDGKMGDINQNRLRRKTDKKVPNTRTKKPMVKITKETAEKTANKNQKERKARQQDYYEEDQLQRLPEQNWNPRKVQQHAGYSQAAGNQGYYDQSAQYQQNQNYQPQDAAQYEQNQNNQQYQQNAQYDKNQNYQNSEQQYDPNQNYQAQNQDYQKSKQYDQGAQYDQNQIAQNRNYQNPEQYHQVAQYDQNQVAQKVQIENYQNPEQYHQVAQYDQNQVAQKVQIENYQNPEQYDQATQFDQNQVAQKVQIENYQNPEYYNQQNPQQDQNQKYVVQIAQTQAHGTGYEQPHVEYLSRKGNNQRRYQVKFTPTQNNGAISLENILNQHEYYPTQSEQPQKQEFIINYQDSQENYDYEDKAQPQALPLVSQYQNTESSQPSHNSQYSNDYQNSNQYYDARQYDTSQQFAPATRVVLDHKKYASLLDYPRAPNLDVTERYSPSSAVIAETATYRSSGLPETATQNVNVLYLFGRNSHYSDYPQSNNLSNPVEYEPTLRVNNYKPLNVPRSHIELNPYLLNLSFAVNPAVVRTPVLLPKALPQLQFPSTFPPSPVPPTTVASDLVSTYASLFNISSDGIIADNGRSGNLYGDAKVTAALNAYALSKQLLSNGSDVLTAIIGNVSYPQPTPSPLLKKKIRPPTQPQVNRFFQGLMETISNGISSLLG